MAWSTPLTAVSNTSLTAAQWNASVRDDLLETAPAKFSAGGQLFVSTAANAGAVRVPQAAFVGTLETTTSTTYTDLATIGPTLPSVITGTSVLVFFRCDAVNSGAGSTLMSFVVTGATSRAASDANAVGPDGSTKIRAGVVVMLFASLTPGANTFNAQYRVTSGTGTFANRQLGVFPL